MSLLRLLPESPQKRRLALAALIYVALTIVYFACAAHDRIAHHTPYNHFAHLAKSWLSGRLDMVTPPPPYAGGNDFAFYDGKWFITFPAFPAVLLLPVVAHAPDVDSVRDGQVFLWLAALGPASLFLFLEKLRERGRHAHSELTCAALAVVFGIGTVFFFTAEQGTVWFAAHVVAVTLACLYGLASIDAEHPLLAGLLLGLCFWTRASLIYAFPWFVFEALRAASLRGNLRESAAALTKRLTLFALPLALLFGLALLHNRARFGDPFEFGYRYLTVGWQGRIEKWGLFSYHYLARNLGVVLTSFPFWNPASGIDSGRFQITIHGLALWITTPIFLWLLFPAQTSPTRRALLLTALLVALPSLFYQNTGQQQFGYRFSNDFAPFLFAALALGTPRMRVPFWAIASLGIAVNLFGALSFERPAMARFYYGDRAFSIYQPD